MLQLAIWGIAAMLLVKAFDVLHQQSVARASGAGGSEALSVAAAFIGFLSAGGLVTLSFLQSGQGTPFASDDAQAVTAAPPSQMGQAYASWKKKTDEMSPAEKRSSADELNRQAQQIRKKQGDTPQADASAAAMEAIARDLSEGN